MSRFIIFSLLLSFVLTSCQLFPGYFLPWANQTAGIGGYADWGPVGNQDFSVESLSYPVAGINLDLEVSPNHRVLIGVSDRVDTNAHVYEYIPGQSWSQLGGGPVPILGIKDVISVAYIYDNVEYAPVTAFHHRGSGFDLASVFTYDRGGSVWNWNVTYTNFLGIHLVSRNQNGFEGPDYALLSFSDMGMWENNGGSSLGSLSFAPSSVYGFRIDHSYQSDQYVVAAGNAGDHYIYQYTRSGVSTNLYHFTSLAYAGVSVEAHQNGNPVAVATYIEASLDLKITEFSANFTNFMFSQPVAGVSSMDTAFKEDGTVLYIALQETGAELKVYSYHIGDTQMTLVGSPIVDYAPEGLTLDLSPDGKRLYLAFLDSSDAWKVKVLAKDI